MDTNTTHDAATDSTDAKDDGMVSLADTTLQRRNGDLVAETIEVEELDGSVRVKPMTRDERKFYVEEVNDPDSGREEITDEELADLFDEKVVEPDLGEHELCPDGEVTERFVREGLSSKGEEGFYIAILLATGEEDMVRTMRGEFDDREMELMLKRMEMQDGSLNGEAPGNATES